MTTTNRHPITRYTVTDAENVAAVGLPKYVVGTWEHYNTTIGEARLARVSGRGRKFLSLPVDVLAKAVEVGLFVKEAA
jgi:hypothetical protein